MQSLDAGLRLRDGIARLNRFPLGQIAVDLELFEDYNNVL
jgi:hypothetical protein